MKIFSTNH